MKDLLNLNTTSRYAFKKHFLVSVHSEIKFNGSLTEVISSKRTQLENALRVLGFAQCQSVVMGQVTFSTHANQPAALQHQSTQIGLKFINASPKRELQLLGDKIILSDFAYDGFNNFAARLREVFEAVNPIINYGQVNKVGLRKINSINISPVESFQDACAIFNPALFSIAKSGLIVDESLRVLEEACVLEKNEHVCIIRTQLARAVQPHTYTANLDFDLVDKKLTDMNTVFNFTLGELNQTHFDLFLWVATQQLRTMMETP